MNVTQAIYGRCYCEAVRFVISAKTEPVIAGYCHCRSCRQAHAAPVYQYVYVKKQQFQITEGAQLLKWYTRDEAARKNFKRYFCERCGSKVYNDLHTVRNDSEMDLRGTFPSLFDDQSVATNSTWGPKMHVSCADSIMTLSQFHDELPRSEK